MKRTNGVVEVILADPIDPSKLAQLMLEWEQTKLKLERLGAQIAIAILDLGRSQEVGNVRASYSGGRKKYDYQAAAEGTITPEVKASCLKQSIDWRRACKMLDIDEVLYTQGNPSVTVKLLR